MGGSSTSHAASRRLSKPRTRRSTTIKTSCSDQEIDLPSALVSGAQQQQDYFGDYAAVVSPKGERRSRRKSRSRIRAYLYGPDNEQTFHSSDEEDGQITLAGAARDVRARISRTSIMQLQSAKTSTTHISNASSSRLHLAGSQCSDAEESAMLADQIKERAYQDNLAAENHVTSPVDEDKHVDSLMAPLRRKSLYTPGLATRHPSDILKKPPQQESNHPQLDRDYYYNPARPKESPLSQLAALQLKEDGRSTPSSVNYLQLGGLELGTLRVTNASPVQRNRSPDTVPDSPGKNRDEYYTASEGSVAGELSAVLQIRGDSPSRTESTSEPLANEHHHDGMTPKNSYPSEKSDHAASIAYQYMAELGDSPFTISIAPPITGSGTTQKSSFEDEELFVLQAEFGSAESRRQSVEDAEARHSNKGSQEDAFRKLNGNAPFVSEADPLSTSHAPDWRCNTATRLPKSDSGYASNASSNDQQPLSEASNVPSKSQPSLVTQRVQPTAPHGEMESSDRCRLSKTISQASPPVVPVPSNSLAVRVDKNSRRISGPREMPQHIPEQGRYSLQLECSAPQPSTFSVIPQEKVTKNVRPSARSSPTVVHKLRKARPKSQPPPVDFIRVQGYHELSQAQIPRVPSIIAARHADRLRQFPLLDHTFPSLDHTNNDDNVSLIGADAGKYPLPIRFPSPANALETAANDQATPVTVVYEERKPHCGYGNNTPDGEPISRPCAFSERRNDIVVQVRDDLWPTSDIVRSPTWSEFGGGRRNKEQKRLAKQEKEHEKRLLREEKDLEKRLGREQKDLEKRMKRDENKQRSSRSRSASRTRAKSSDRSSRDTVTTIADFGTVAESLGGSPYDIATAMFPPPSTSKGASNRHPHQISNAMTRPKSAIVPDSVGIHEFDRAWNMANDQSFSRPSVSTARARIYHDGATGRAPRPQTLFADAPPAPALAAIDLKVHDMNWARCRQRSHSFSGAPLPTTGPSNDRGGLPGRSFPPKIASSDAPPVPPLPSAQQVRQREAQIVRSRPQSMIADASPRQSPSALTNNANDVDVESEGSPVSRSGMLGRPRKTRTSKMIPDLWSSGSLEKKGPRPTPKSNVTEAVFDASSSDDTSVANENNAWEAQRLAWRSRRESAGEALLRNQLTEMLDNRTVTSSKSVDQSAMSPTKPRGSTAQSKDLARSREPLRPGPSPLGLPNPLSSHPTFPQDTSRPAPDGLCQSNPNPDRPVSHNQSPSHRASPAAPNPTAPRNTTAEDPSQVTPPNTAQRRASTFTIPRKRIGSGASTPTKAMDRLTGRYEGGLLYGYEPGCGLGGSAGTRGAKTEASRKSVQVSKGFGLDLSDVPIFLAATPAK